MQRSMQNEEIDGESNLNIIGRGDSNLLKIRAVQRAWGLMCKKSKFKRVLKGGETICLQNQIILEVVVVQE